MLWVSPNNIQSASLPPLGVVGVYLHSLLYTATRRRARPIDSRAQKLVVYTAHNSSLSLVYDITSVDSVVSKHNGYYKYINISQHFYSVNSNNLHLHKCKTLSKQYSTSVYLLSSLCSRRGVYYYIYIICILHIRYSVY